MYTLVVVDMQDKFRPARDTFVQNNCKQAIRAAIKNKAAIIFLEYINYGPTLPCLTNLVKKYKRVFHSEKNDWSGAPQVELLVGKHKLPSHRFKVCGVYTECCVLSTVNHLSGLFKASKIEILSNSCGSDNKRDYEFGIVRMKLLNNVKVQGT